MTRWTCAIHGPTSTDCRGCDDELIALTESEHAAENGLLIPSHWNPHWNYRLGGEPRSICACPDGPYEGARLATLPRFCERCGGLVSVTPSARTVEKDAGLMSYHDPNCGCGGDPYRCPFWEGEDDGTSVTSPEVTPANRYPAELSEQMDAADESDEVRWAEIDAMDVKGES